MPFANTIEQFEDPFEPLEMIETADDDEAVLAEMPRQCVRSRGDRRIDSFGRNAIAFLNTRPRPIPNSLISGIVSFAPRSNGINIPKV
jgi:hypothetical protein